MFARRLWCGAGLRHAGGELFLLTGRTVRCVRAVQIQPFGTTNQPLPLWTNHHPSMLADGGDFRSMNEATKQAHAHSQNLRLWLLHVVF